MKKALVFGGSGHCGSYLVPRLVDMGYEVHSVSRGVREPYTCDMPQWAEVQKHVLDRRSAEDRDAAGQMAVKIAPDVICDLISYTKEEMEGLMEPILARPALAEKMHIVQVGTVWVYGVKLAVPVTEEHPRNSTDGYGIGKAAIEKYLHGLSAEGKIKSTVIFPGHISGRGWVPINPQGHVNIEVYRDIKAGKPVLIPDDGNHTLHHVHSADIAALIGVCLANPDKSNGETFHATTERAVTMAGFAEALYTHYGHEPKLEFVRLEELQKKLGANDFVNTTRHMMFSSHCSMEKAKRVLGFTPAYSTMDTILDALAWQEENGNL
ncbi:MAG: NAD-dependent epimerase/dehydratase family protein [Clostridia bacterium]|nr:NAD-dependent epimerase/dehydratase family protein [Oscillospiraceae bacterium]MBQ7033383.1 NAD-dependent epimerase/dehydratase family protein [Clostridia bacterium]